MTIIWRISWIMGQTFFFGIIVHLLFPVLQNVSETRSDKRDVLHNADWSYMVLWHLDQFQWFMTQWSHLQFNGSRISHQHHLCMYPDWNGDSRATRVFQPTSNLYRKNIWILLVFVMHVDMIFDWDPTDTNKSSDPIVCRCPWSKHAWKAIKTLRVYVRYDIDKPNLLWLILAARPYGWTNDCCIVLRLSRRMIFWHDGSPSWRERVNLHKVKMGVFFRFRANSIWKHMKRACMEDGHLTRKHRKHGTSFHHLSYEFSQIRVSLWHIS